MQMDIPLLKIYETILNSVHEGIIVTDRYGNIIHYSSELAKQEDLDPKKVIGKNLTDVYNNVTFDTSEHLRVIESGEPVLERRKQYFTNKGKEVNIVASTFPVYEGAEVVAAYSICRDITMIKELLTKTMTIQEQISHDGTTLPRNNGTRFTFDSIVHASSSISSLINSAKKTAESDCSVLVFGETGTGKELLVQGIHNYSARKDEPFVAINCAAIPETLLESILFGTTKGAFTGAVEGKGLFEQAGKGTLVLDEINSMSIFLQAKLLRVLQEKSVRRVGGSAEIPVRCRVISSTNVDPWECVSKGQLRKDLFYRLAVISLYIPPLRERPEDIQALLSHFMRKYQRIYGMRDMQISSGLQLIFEKYQWPGNVRELEHIIESAINLSDGENQITIDQLPPYLKTKFQVQESMRKDGGEKRSGSLASVLIDVERKLLTDALAEYSGNITQAANSLGIARQNMQYRIKKLRLKSNQSIDVQ